nr:replicative DNA helicase [Candidatus Dormibacteraeota bacterium]
MTSTSREARIPPHDLDAETSVLGAILLDQAAITRVLDFLHPEDFYRENNGHVYRAAQNLFREGEPIDNVTLAAELEKLGVLERVGGRAQLALLQESVPTAANVEYYARIVKDRAYKRRLITSGANVTALGYEESLDADEAVNKAQSEIYAISDDRVGGAMERLYDLLKPAMDRIDAQMASGGGVLGIASGFHDLDRMTNGYKPSDLVIIAGRPSMGKALALDTPIPTPTGWRTMQSLRVGDQVFDERGRACTVTFATPVMLGHRCYEVLLSDGEKLIADAEHQWSVRTRAARKRQGAAVVLTTEQMAGAVRLSTGRLNYSIPTCQPLEYPEWELPLDPYVLGVWLGDGNTHGAVVTIGEPEVLTELQAAGCPVRPRALRGGKTPQVALSTGSRLGQNAKLTVSQVVAIRSAREAGQTLEAIATDYGVSAAVILRQLGVLGRKHIPRSYLEASVQQRVALLQGLMDTDGSIDGLGYAEFSVKSRELAEGALELVLGLGLKAKLAAGRSQLNGVDCGPRYRVQFLPGDFPICRIPSMAKRQRKVRPFARSRERRVAAIREVPSVPVRCIQVDSPDHLYLAGRACVPTHNTSFVLNVALNAAVEQKKPIAVFSLEMSKEQLVERMLCEQARIDAQRLHRGTLSDVEYERLAGALGPLGDAPIWIDDSPMLDDLTLRLKARQARAREGIEMIILDY